MDDVLVLTHLLGPGAPTAVERCPVVDGQVVPVFVRAIDEYGALSPWTYTVPEARSGGCASVPFGSGLSGFPLLLVLLGLRRRR